MKTAAVALVLALLPALAAAQSPKAQRLALVIGNGAYKVSLKVGAEEEVPTPMGPMRGLRIERESQWKQRGSDNAGVSRWTYWYNSAAKRFVAAEESNTTSAGKVLSRARHELAAYDVK